MKYAHILWDWNGTLLDDVRQGVSALNATFAAFGVEQIGVEKYRETFSFPVKKFYEGCGMDFSKHSEESVDEFFITSYNAVCGSCKLFVDEIQTLEMLKSEGVRQSILSAYQKNRLVNAVRARGIDAYMDSINGLDNIRAESKVSLGIKCIKELGLPPEKVLVVGDTLHDMETANAMGTDCVLMCNGHCSKKRLGNAGIRVFDGFKGLANFLQSA